MNILDYLLLGLFFFVAEVLYFKVAERFEIIDVPNYRSSHENHTIRGIGVIFLLAILSYAILSGYRYPYFIIGMLLIGGISFVDDIHSLPNRFRLSVQLVSLGLLLYQIFQQYNDVSVLLIFFLLIVCVGIVNAYNFMDGINGITGAYSLLLIVTLYYTEKVIISFIDDQLLIILGISVIVFLFFNFRKKAVGFCGDVGSVGIAFAIVFGIALLINVSGEWKYFFFLSVYGLDTIYTLIYRLSIRENIFIAHKVHFYQLLVHSYSWGHLKVAFLYILVQLLINISIIQEIYLFPVFIVPVAFSLIVMHFFRSQVGKGIRLPNNKL